jgi:probable HAF family extracellular repeat protein
MEGTNVTLKQTVLKSIVGGSLLAAVAIAQSPTYTVTDLGMVGPNGQPFAITNNGLVASGVQTGNTLQAVLWYKGKMKDLGTPGLQGPNSQALGVNHWGQVVGEAQTTTPDPNGEDFCGFAGLGLASSGTTCVPFVWQDGVMHALPTLGGNNGLAYKINIWGAAAGTAENDTPDSTCPSGSPQKLRFKPVLWKNGSPQELPTDPGDPDGSANAINDLGQAAGASGTCAAFNPINANYFQPLHALLWEDGKAIDLGTLGGTGLGSTPFNGIQAMDLNNRGQVVGSSDLQGDANFHGFLWTRETGMQDLGTVPGDANSLAIGINDAGQVVGASIDATLTNVRAFLRQDGKLIDLNTLVPAGYPLYLFTACKIDAAGEIIGLALDSSGNFHGYLAVPNSHN